MEAGGKTRWKTSFPSDKFNQAIAFHDSYPIDDEIRKSHLVESSSRGMYTSQHGRQKIRAKVEPWMHDLYLFFRWLAQTICFLLSQNRCR